MIDAGHAPIRFNGMLGGLRAWARAVGLLRGQRNRSVERALSNLRNFVAHPTSYHLVDPWRAAQTLSDLAEIINHLWGSPTAGGRLYPAPIRREVVVLAWSIDGGSVQVAHADGLPTAVEPEGTPWRYALVRAVFRPEDMFADPGLDFVDARFEVTHFPADPLWGPGSLAEATAWWAAHSPTGDECDYLDRSFLVQRDGDQLYLPMRPAAAATLGAAEQAGTWYVVRADFPEDASQHVRTLVTRMGCTTSDECAHCPAHTLAVGSYDEVHAYLTVSPGSPDPLPDFRTPWAPPRSRDIDS